MATLDQLKALFPDARSDSDLIKQAASEFGISPADIAAEVGVKISTPGFGTSVKRGAGQVASALGSTARDLGLERAGRAVESYGEDVAFRNPAAVNTVSEAISSPWQTTKEALGELVPQIGVSGATALGGRALGGFGGRALGGLAGIPFGPAGVAAGQAIGGTAGAYLGNLAQEYGGIRSEQRESGKEDKTRALGAGAAAAVLDTAVGVERLVNKVGNKGLNILSREAGESLPKHVLKQTGLGIATEAGTETAQTALERYGAFKDLTGADALNEYGMAAIKGGIGGGVVRGGLSAIAGERTSLIPDTDQGATPTTQGAPANDISQAFQTNDRTTPDAIMSGLVGRAADPLAGRSSLVGQTAVPTAPAVSGGETAIAQAQQQAQVESQQIQAALARQARREQIYTEYGIADPQNPAKGNLFGKPLFGRTVPAVADAIGTATQTMTPYQLELAQAVNQANTETGGKLLNFQFNANDPAKSVQKAFEAVGKVAVGFQIADVQSAAEASQILNEQSKTLTGNKLEQLNAIHYALTGEDTVGFLEAQQSKAAKGAKDGKLQLQNNAGLRNVPVQSGTGKATDGGDGNVRPAQVQPLGAAGLGEGPLGLQVGQLPTEGVRAGTSADTGVGDGQPTPNTQVTPLDSETRARIQSGVASLDPDDRDLWALQLERKLEKNGVLTWKDIPQDLNSSVDTVAFAGIKDGITTNPQETIALIRGTQQGAPNEATQAIVGGGQVSGEQQQAPATQMGGQSVQAGPRIYANPPSYYATDLSHIQSERRVNIILDLLTTVLKPQQERKNTVPAEKRAELLRLALMEQMPHKTIAEVTGLKVDTVEKQLERMGVKLQDGEFQVVDPALAVSVANAAANYRSPEFPDGIGEGELMALYTTRYEGEDAPTQSMADEFEQEAKPEAKLQEELRGKDEGEGKTMGVVATAGGSQGAVEGTDDAFFAKVGKLQAMLDMASDADKPNVQKQLDAAWAQYGKKQTKRIEANRLEEVEGEEDAVQEPSTEEVPVRKRARGGKTVGEGNAKGGKAAAKSETKVEEPKQEVVVQTPEEQWSALAEQFPGMPPYESLTKDEKIRWDDLASRGVANLAAANKVLGSVVKAGPTEAPRAGRAAEKITDESRIIDGTGLVREISPEQIQLLQAPVKKLSEGQTARLEKHYGVKSGTTEFFTKLHEDVVLYATKGAEAVAAAIRDIVKAVHAGVLSVAMIFNPNGMSQLESFVVIPQETQVTQQVVEAQLPAEVQNMSDAGKQAYATLIPALQEQGYKKFVTIADKPSGRVYVFKADGSLVLQKKALFGLAKGDLYKGNNDIPSNRVTPAGLFGIKVIDAAKGGSAAKTAGEYDFGKVFALEDPDAVVTFMHSVWLKESDAAKRAAALKSESAADSRYSFGCINLDKETFGQMVTNYADQMDGSKLFVVPDVQSTVADFLAANVPSDKLVREGVRPVTRTVETPVRSATQVAGLERAQAAKEEELPPEVSGIRFMRTAQTLDIDGVVVTANETTLGALERNRGVWNAIDSYRQAGMEHILKAVDGWYVTDNDVDWDGSFMALDGKPSIAFQSASLKNDAIAEWTTHHEIGHAIDMLHKEQGGVYSGLPGLNVSVVGNRIVARGDVMRAVVDHYNAEPNSMLSQHLVYPLDRTQNAELDADGVREEVFAQLWATYNTVDGREFLETNLPNVADFMEAVYEDVKQTQYVTETANGAAPQGRAGVQGQGRGPQPRQVRLQASAIRANKTQEINDRPTGMFAKAGSWLDTMLTNPKQAYQELKLGFLTLEQLAELDKSPTQVVRAYADVSIAMQMTSKRLVERAAQIDQLWSKLDAETSKRLSNVMRQATRMSFDPDMSFDDITAVNHGEKELTPEQSALRSEFETLPTKAQEVYRRVRDHYAASFEMRKQIMEDVGARLGGKELKEIQDMYSKVKGPYFPLGRTGDYYAVGMSPRVAELMDKKDAGTLDRKEAAELSRLRKQKSQYQASAHSTLAEAKQAAERYRNQLGTGYANKKSERISDRISSMPNFSNMEEYINTQLGGETRTEVRSMLTQMMFDMLPEHHALKNQMKREGIYGENEDMRQVFAQTSINQAHYISRLQHSEKLNQAMLAVGRQARRDIDMRNLENELKLRTKLSMEQTNSPVMDALVNASYFAHLGLSPAFLLTNLTQVPMVTAPWLGARHGVGATKRAMASALSDTSKLIKTTYADGDWRSELNWNTMFPEGSNEDRMFRALLDRNVLDITMEHDLAAIASANRGFFDDRIAKASKGKLQGMSDVIRMVNTPVRITELANRAVTALSAYRLKMAALASNTAMTPEQRHEASVNYAARAVSETQLNYSELNAPRHMRQVFGSKAIAKMVFQFRKYQQGMLYLVAKNISDSLPGSKATDEERRIARRTIAGLYITTGLMAGTTGMPLMGTVGLAGIANLIAAAFGEEDEPWDFEVEYRNFLTDWFGRDVALLLAKGLPAYLGADLSQRVGMAELANPIPFVQRGATGASTVANVLYAAGGAPLGMIGTMYDGLVSMANGDTLKGVEKIIPVKMMKDALRMYRYTDEGLTDRRGNVILPPEKFDTIDLALRGMGFAPTIESEYYAANEAVQSAKTAATDVRTRLIRQFSEARMRGEPVDDIRQEIAQFNQRHPEQGIRITESTLIKAMNARRQMAAQRNEAGVRIGKAEKPFADRARFATADEE